MRIRPVSALLRGFIFAYRTVLSPIMGRQCRYLPTCSQYGDEAIRRHGPWIGAWMTLARVLRCNPWGPSGFDPVPDTADGTAWSPWRAARWTGAHMDPTARLDR